MSVPQYFVQPHAYICLANRYWTILDLNRDRYLCIHRQDFDQLVPFLSNARQDSITHVERASHPSPTALALGSQLISQGILAESAPATSELNHFIIAKPRSAIEIAAIRPRISSCYAFAPAFLFACARADYNLRYRPIGQIVRGIRARRYDLPASATAFDFDRGTRLVAAFSALRPLYPRRYLCLFDCLSLLYFLEHQSLFPTWVFGVTADPFEAHCWVQADDVLLCDTIDHSSKLYTPIMCV